MQKYIRKVGIQSAFMSFKEARMAQGFACIDITRTVFAITVQSHCFQSGREIWNFISESPKIRWV